MIFWEVDEKSLKEEAQKTKEQVKFIYNKLKMFILMILNFFLLIAYIYLVSYNYFLSKEYSKLIDELQKINLDYKIFSSKLTTYYSKDYIQKILNTNLYIPAAFIFLYGNSKALIIK